MTRRPKAASEIVPGETMIISGGDHQRRGPAVSSPLIRRINYRVVSGNER